MSGGPLDWLRRLVGDSETEDDRFYYIPDDPAEAITAVLYLSELADQGDERAQRAVDAYWAAQAPAGPGFRLDDPNPVYRDIARVNQFMGRIAYDNARFQTLWKIRYL